MSWNRFHLPVLFIPFHSLSVTLHFSISSQTLEGSSCWNIYWSVFLFSLSALFIFLCLSCPPPKQSNKVQRCQLSEAEEGLISSTTIPYLSVFNSLVSQQRAKFGWWCNVTRISDSCLSVDGLSLQNNHFLNPFCFFSANIKIPLKHLLEKQKYARY